jgi:hypothetical protein
MHELLPRKVELDDCSATSGSGGRASSGNGLQHLSLALLHHVREWVPTFS